MAENIKLADFDIDVSSVIKNITELRKKVDELKESQKEAKKAGQDQTDAYTINEAAIKSLNGELRRNQKALDEVLLAKGANAKATKEAADREELLTIALQHEATTIEGLRAQNKVLSQLRNQTNITTEQGRLELEQLNSQLNKNNDLIKENVDELSQQKINVGNYTDSIKDALGTMNPMNQSLGSYAQRVQEAGGVSNFFGTQLKALATGIKGVTKASVAFLLTPIGAVIGAIGLALGVVVTALNSTQKGMDMVTSVTRPLAAILEVMLGVVQDLGLALIEAFSNPKETLQDIYNFIKDRVVSQFKALSTIAEGLFTWDFAKVEEGFNQFTKNVADGFNLVADAANGVVSKIQEGVTLGQELDRLTKQHEETQIRNAELLPQLNATLREYNKIAEDTTKSVQEREAAAVRTVEISKQINEAKKEELGLELAIAENQAARNDTSRADELAIAEIKGKMHEADAQAAELQTTQQNKINTIRKDGITQQQKAVEKQIATQKDLLNLFVAEQGERARTMQEELTLEEQVSERKKEILKAELEAKKLSHEAYMVELIRIDENLARRRAEIAIDSIARELEINKQSIDKQKEGAQFLSEELATQRKAQNDNILLQEQQLAEQKLINGLINQQEFDDAIRELKETNRIANQEIDKERDSIERQENLELARLRFNEDLARMIEDNASRFEIERAIFADQQKEQKQALDEQLKGGVISQELYNARLKALGTDLAMFNKELAEQERDAKVAATQTALTAVSSLIDKNSAAGKGVAVAQSLINTYQGITKALAASPPPFNFVAAAAVGAAGLKSVMDIVSTKVPKADGNGTVGGSTGQGGTSLSGELQNLGSNESNLSAVAASGNATVQGQIQQNADQSLLADNMAQAVREGARQGTQQGSEQGLTNLSTNKQIENLSSF